MIAAVDQIEYLGGPENNTGDVTPALWQTARLFSRENGARNNDTGVSRIGKSKLQYQYLGMTQNTVNPWEKLVVYWFGSTWKKAEICG